MRAQADANTWKKTLNRGEMALREWAANAENGSALKEFLAELESMASAVAEGGDGALAAVACEDLARLNKVLLDVRVDNFEVDSRTWKHLSTICVKKHLDMAGRVDIDTILGIALLQVEDGLMTLQLGMEGDMTYLPKERTVQVSAKYLKNNIKRVTMLLRLRRKLFDLEDSEKGKENFTTKTSISSRSAELDGSYFDETEEEEKDGRSHVTHDDDGNSFGSNLATRLSMILSGMRSAEKKLPPKEKMAFVENVRGILEDCSAKVLNCISSCTTFKNPIAFDLFRSLFEKGQVELSLVLLEVLQESLQPLLSSPPDAKAAIHLTTEKCIKPILDKVSRCSNMSFLNLLCSHEICMKIAIYLRQICESAIHLNPNDEMMFELVDTLFNCFQDGVSWQLKSWTLGLLGCLLAGTSSSSILWQTEAIRRAAEVVRNDYLAQVEYDLKTIEGSGELAAFKEQGVQWFDQLVGIISGIEQGDATLESMVHILFALFEHDAEVLVSVFSSCDAPPDCNNENQGELPRWNVSCSVLSRLLRSLPVFPFRYSVPEFKILVTSSLHGVEALLTATNSSSRALVVLLLHSLKGIANLGHFLAARRSSSVRGSGAVPLSGVTFWTFSQLEKKFNGISSRGIVRDAFEKTLLSWATLLAMPALLGDLNVDQVGAICKYITNLFQNSASLEVKAAGCVILSGLCNIRVPEKKENVQRLLQSIQECSSACILGSAETPFLSSLSLNSFAHMVSSFPLQDKATLASILAPSLRGTFCSHLQEKKSFGDVSELPNEEWMTANGFKSVLMFSGDSRKRKRFSDQYDFDLTVIDPVLAFCSKRIKVSEAPSECEIEEVMKPIDDLEKMWQLVYSKVQNLSGKGVSELVSRRMSELSGEMSTFAQRLRNKLP